MAPRLGRPRLNLLELSLAAGVLGAVLAGMPLGLSRLPNGALVQAGLTLRTGVDLVSAAPDCPPLVLFLLRVASWLPVGDLAMRVNLAAGAAAALAAVLLSRLIARVLRDLNDGRPVGETVADDGVGVGVGDETLVPGMGPRRTVTVDETTGAVAVSAAGGAPAGWSAGPQIFAEKGVAVDPQAVAPVPRRRTSEEAASALHPLPEIAEGDRTYSEDDDPERVHREPTLRVAAIPSRERTHPAHVHEAPTRPVPMPVREPTGRAMREATTRARAAAHPGRSQVASVREPTGRMRAADTGTLAGPLRGQVRLPTHQAMALLGGVVAPLASVAVFAALTTSPATAVSLALILGVWLRLLAFERSPGTPRRALVMALLAGLALAADPVTPLFVWPPALLCGLRWFRRGERWPLLAPVAFAVGVVAALPLIVVGADGEAGSSPARAAIDFLLRVLQQRPSFSGLFSVGAEAVGQLGVVALLVALVGAAVMLTRRPRLFAFSVTMAGLALALVAVQGQMAGAPELGRGYGLGVAYGLAAPAWAILIASVAVPLAVGIAHLSGKLGPARGGAALALAVMVAVWPAFDGGLWRFRRSTAVHEALLTGIEGKLAPGVAAIPGSTAADALLRYGQVVGRRPDLALPVVRLSN